MSPVRRGAGIGRRRTETDTHSLRHPVRVVARSGPSDRYINVERYQLTRHKCRSVGPASCAGPRQIRPFFLSNLPMSAVRARGSAGSALAPRGCSSRQSDNSYAHSGGGDVKVTTMFYGKNGMRARRGPGRCVGRGDRVIRGPGSRDGAGRSQSRSADVHRRRRLSHDLLLPRYPPGNGCQFDDVAVRRPRHRALLGRWRDQERRRQRWRVEQRADRIGGD